MRVRVSPRPPYKIPVKLGFYIQNVWLIILAMQTYYSETVNPEFETLALAIFGWTWRLFPIFLLLIVAFYLGVYFGFVTPQALIIGVVVVCLSVYWLIINKRPLKILVAEDRVIMANGKKSTHIPLADIRYVYVDNISAVSNQQLSNNFDHDLAKGTDWQAKLFIRKPNDPRLSGYKKYISVNRLVTELVWNTLPYERQSGVVIGRLSNVYPSFISSQHPEELKLALEKACQGASVKLEPIS